MNRGARGFWAVSALLALNATLAPGYQDWVTPSPASYDGVYRLVVTDTSENGVLEAHDVRIDFSGDLPSVRLEKRRPTGRAAAPAATSAKVEIHGSRIRAEFYQDVTGSKKPWVFMGRFVRRVVPHAGVVPGLLSGRDFYGRVGD